MKKVAILTSFQEFLPGYSLTGIVKDQIEMLTRYGHEVHLFVSEKYHEKETLNQKVVVHKAIPFAHLHDFTSKAELENPQFQSREGKPAGYFRDLTSKTVENLKRELAGLDIVFTHDFVFIGWNAPYGWACMEVGKELKSLRWMHWIHSVPTGRRDYWDIGQYGRAHKLIYPNMSDRIRVAESFNGRPEDVRVIPHIKDMRTWGDYDSETCDFISEYPSVMQADVVQVYPSSVDRLEAKRLREVILIFSKIKRMGRSVCLVVANQWATGRQQKQNIETYKKIAFQNGLKPGDEVVFTSDWKTTERNGELRGKYDVGIPKRILRELFQISNLFIFPTKEESFGLVLPEASLSSGCLCVLNQSLQQQLEISGFNALYFDFGSFHHEVKISNEEQYWTDLATLIVGRMGQSESLKTKTFMRQRYNYDSLYRDYYAPIMADSTLWDV